MTVGREMTNSGSAGPESGSRQRDGGVLETGGVAGVSDVVWLPVKASQ